MIEFSRKSYENLVKDLKALPHEELLKYVDLVAKNQKEAEKVYRKARKDSEEYHSLRRKADENEILNSMYDRVRNYTLGGWIEEQFKNDKSLQSIKIKREQVNLYE